ncbi:alkaline phosphatase family protein [Flavisphingomonas formosensis]|uniref:alkaline phosphatase family protein n=1 Tax=Flavisphingomonas formosensis TaxID=861534 RepID=UPI001E4AA384|nr:alkaline phosphatase family protein [Sphingomonas formosensis]
MKFTSVAMGLGLFIVAGPAVAAPLPKPKLIVAISVDQFAAGLFETYRASYEGGLKTLSNGIVYTAGYQSHAATETCPGHSTILTGRHPSATGIAANSWYDAPTGSNVYCVGISGTSDPDARGPQNLRVPTLGEWMKQAQPASRVIAVSGKDRAAITMAGHDPDAVYWWKDGTGFITSHYAGPATPEVLKPARTFNTMLAASWQKAPPALWPRPSATCAALQKPYRFGKIDLPGTVPSSAAAEQGADYAKTTMFQDQLRASPYFDQLALDFATKLIALHKLGHGSATDLLAVSLSATDYIGHRYGNGGAEMCVQMAALDQALGGFLDTLKALDVPVLVVLTADHGAMDAAERAADHGQTAKRINGKKLIDELNGALNQKFSLGYDPIVGDDPQQLSINIPGDDADFRARLTEAAIAWLKARPEVAAAFTAAEVAAATTPIGMGPDELTLIQRFNESYVPGRSGDIMVSLQSGDYPGIPVAAGDTVAGHGSPWDYDRRVPILFWWPGVSADDRKIPIETVDIAPTLATVIGVKTSKLDGKCLTLAANMPCPQ